MNTKTIKYKFERNECFNKILELRPFYLIFCFFITINYMTI